MGEELEEWGVLFSVITPGISGDHVVVGIESKLAKPKARDNLDPCTDSLNT